ncbi:MAG: MotA/TolQ/ExbB proton channel family protein [Fibrobacter sp.]|nr:MotA/TolQ/ExbB proton channel family protein [Fibrobacter sp.]
MSNSLYIVIEALRNTFYAGGVVMLPILVCGVVGFCFLYSAWFRIGSDYFKKDSHKVVRKLRSDLNDEKCSVEMRLHTAKSRLKKRRGIIARELLKALRVAEEHPEQYTEYMQVRVIKTKRYMEQGNHIISVMASAAPLLGLLGTVTGMMSTFDVITLYGNQNPVLMADGISEALISTQSGLLVAFPLTLMKQRLDERVDILMERLQLGATIIESVVHKDVEQKVNER